MFIKIVENDRHFAQNGPTGITINTGTRYFAAVLLQEWYEFVRYAAWFWGLPAIFFAAAGGAYFAGFGNNVAGALAGAGISAMILVSARLLPFNVADRELNGQAIEIAAIRYFYGRKGMDAEYRLQARSMIRIDSPYVAKGYWPDVEPINPAEYTNEMALAGIPHPSIDKIISMLKAREPFAKRYVLKHWDKLTKWQPLGADSIGY